MTLPPITETVTSTAVIHAAAVLLRALETDAAGLRAFVGAEDADALTHIAWAITDPMWGLLTQYPDVVPAPTGQPGLAGVLDAARTALGAAALALRGAAADVLGTDPAGFDRYTRARRCVSAALSDLEDAHAEAGL